MFDLKQNTAITWPVFAHDASGDAVTGLVDAGFTKRISKNGGAFAAMTVTLTEMENGWYSVPIGTGHSDTLGALTITLTHTSIKQINLQFRVYARINDDLAFPTDSGRSIDVAPTGEVALDFDNTRGTLAKTTDITGFNDLSAAQVNAEVDTALNTAIPGSPTADSINERIKAIDDKLPSKLYFTGTANSDGDVEMNEATGNYGGSVASVVGAVGSVVGSIGGNLAGNVAGTVASVVGSVGGNLGGSVIGSIGGLAANARAQVGVQVSTGLSVTTYAEPGQGAPAATNTIEQKTAYVFKAWRNKKLTSAGNAYIYNDAGAVVDQKAALSDDGTDFTHGEFVSGP